MQGRNSFGLRRAAVALVLGLAASQGALGCGEVSVATTNTSGGRAEERGPSAGTTGGGAADVGTSGTAGLVESCTPDAQSSRTVVAVLDATASTNSPHIRLTVFGDHSAERAVLAGSDVTGVLPADFCYPAGSPAVAACVATFQSVDDASQIPVADSCAKPVSFGTELFLTVDGKTSGDVSCPLDSTSVAVPIYRQCGPLLGYY